MKLLNFFLSVGLAVALSLGTLAAPTWAQSGKFRVYIGTYTGKGQQKVDSEGIYTALFDSNTGALSDVQLAAKLGNPSFLAIAPDGKHLYAVGEGGGEVGKAVNAFKLDAASGKLEFLNSQSGGGNGSCHIICSKNGKGVLVANYGSGSVCSVQVKGDGSLGDVASAIQHTGTSVDKGCQEAPHAHSIFLDAANKFAFSPDLGIDKVMIYRFDSETAKLTPSEPAFAKVAPGSGPRHFAFHTSGKYAYVINEMLCTITAFAYDAEKGTLTEIQTLPTLASVKPARGDSTAEIVVHPSGKFLYGSNRGNNTIASFTIDQATGKLTATGHQGEQVRTPRNFNVDPTGKWCLVANQDGDSVIVFAIDPETGKLSPTAHKAVVGMPVCVKFLAL